MSHHSVELDEPILKMYTVLGFEIWVFHKIIEENWKQFCIEIISPYLDTEGTEEILGILSDTKFFFIRQLLTSVIVTVPIFLSLLSS